MAGVLFRLGGDGAGIVGNENHHTAFDADVGKAHQGVACHVEAHLFHGDHGAGACIGGARRHL